MKDLPLHAGDDVQGPDWEGHMWSAWLPLDEAISAWRAKAPADQGLYRIRAGEVGLIYIGESGRSILERLRQLRKATEYVVAGKKPGPPHVAGGCVLAHEQRGDLIEISWVETPDLHGRERKGIECELIGAYRKTMGNNPTCQFAGTIE